jgi:pimeloyl-ACP methyl ester carboxylesterase
MSTSSANLRFLHDKAFEALAARYKCQFDVLRPNLCIDTGLPQKIDISMYMIRLSKCNHGTTKKMFLIHGLNSGPLHFENIIPYLLEEGFTIFLPSLPGFGMTESSCIIQHLSKQQVLVFYEAFTWQMFHHFSPHEKPMVVAHSLGAFLMAHFYSNHPERIEKLVFVDGIGLLPTLSTTGKYWSFLFKAGIPNRLARPLGRAWNACLFSLVATGSNDRYAHLWRIAQMTCETNIADIICSKFISFAFFDSRWNEPIFTKLLHRNVNIVLVWGAKDSIIPCHAAKLLQDLSACTESIPFPLYIIRDGNHSPIQTNDGKDFVAILKHIVRPARKVAEPNTEGNHSFLDPLHALIRSSEGACFCVSHTKKHIVHFYGQILQLATGHRKLPYHVVDKKFAVTESNHTASYVDM